MSYIMWFSDISMKDVPSVGGKNASLGQMIGHLSSAGVTVPDGFATTAAAYWYVLKHNKLVEPIKELMRSLSPDERGQKLRDTGAAVRKLISSVELPDDLKQELATAYAALSKKYAMADADVAVRSSATAEDLPTASFAGQQETYLNVRGIDELYTAVKHGMASLFTDRAIVYRNTKGFDHFAVALSVGVQKMIRSDKACSGVAFSLDTETGFKDVVMINASYGLGEAIVQGLVTPDEYMVHKPTLADGFEPIIKKECGAKSTAIVYADAHGEGTKHISVPQEKQQRFALTDDEILHLARMVVTIEDHYSHLAKTWRPMDIEWAKDGNDGKLYILQARPETVHAPDAEKNALTITQYVLDTHTAPKVLAAGISIGQSIATGVVRIVHDVKDIDEVKDGDVLVTGMTDPDWVPAMKRAAAIVTERGGRTCHAAIVSRELGIPAIIGVDNAMHVLRNGQTITLDCSQGEAGYIYDGIIAFVKKETPLKNIPKPPVEVMLNIGEPGRAFALSFLPVSGVGLARVEFIITNSIKIHPLALVHPEKISDANIRETIERITASYDDKKQFFVDTLAHNVGMIAAAFYPRPVLVRLSDFKTNEYRNLLGGQYFEPHEENPMLGFRGASRYYSAQYADAFALECAALKKVRTTMGLTNVKIMVPFVRTVSEAQKVRDSMLSHGLKRGEQGLELVMMCEVPSNVVCIEQFAEYFDGFSIGSNDLTQLTLGVDRDSELLATLFDERDPAVQEMVHMVIKGAHKASTYIGICGQAPSDYPEFAEFLIKESIDSISLNPDSVLPFLMRGR